MNIRNSDDAVDLEEILLKFGVFRRYHGLLAFLVLLGNLTNAMYDANFIFAAEEVKSTLNRTSCLKGLIIVEEVKEVCQDLRTWKQLLDLQGRFRCIDESFNGTAICNSVNSSYICKKWVYDNPHSFVAEFELACQDWKRSFVGTVHSLGYMIGLLIVGPMSDRIGRKKTVIITGVTGGVLGIARSFAAWYWLYVACEFLEAMIGDICSPIFMLAVEMVATKTRATLVTFTSIGFPVGGAILALVAWLFPYWRTFIRVIYTPALLFIFYKYLIDESPRWLLTKGRKEEAIAVIQKAANRNNMLIDKVMLEKQTFEKTETVKFLDLLKSTFVSMKILKRFFICVVWWITSTFVHFGMLINSVSLQGNKYINFALMAMIEIPALFLVLYILKNFRRKTSLIGSFFVGALLCLVQPFTPSDMVWLSIILYMLGKLMSGFYFNITYIYTSELFPTYTRNSMHALCSSLGRIGSIIAPQTPQLMVYWTGLPAIVFGGMALFAGLVTFFVPDTAQHALPDTVKEAEELEMKSKEVNGDAEIQ